MNLLILFTLLLELVILNLNVMKGHAEFWEKPLVLYCTICRLQTTITSKGSLYGDGVDPQQLTCQKVS